MQKEFMIDGRAGEDHAAGVQHPVSGLASGGRKEKKG